MVVETQVIPYLRWLFSDCGDGQSSLRHFVVAALVLVVLCSSLAYLVAGFRHGPRRGALLVLRALWAGVVDIARMSPRRVFALTGLAVREAFRRYIWVALVVFLVILLFTGWFLNPRSDDPAKLYLGFVLNATTFLMLIVALYLSALSLPADIKNRTIHTIVTKPVRASELVLGRVLGFACASTMLLVVMGGASYLFVTRALSHTHEITAADVSEDGLSGQTSSVANHRHKFSIPAGSFSPGVELTARADGGFPVVRQVTAAARAKGINPGDLVTAVGGQATDNVDIAVAQERLLGPAGSTVKLTLSSGGKGREVELARTSAQTLTEVARGHWHRVIARWANGKISYEVGPAEGMFAARVPIYGTLQFRDRQGDPERPNTWQFRQRGINVGKLFTYRSYIEGNTMAGAMWSFENLRAQEFPNGLPLDITLSVYRSSRGKIGEGLRGSWQVINPLNPTVASEKAHFTAKDSGIDHIQVPIHLLSTRGKRLNLFKDFVAPNGRLDILIQCDPPGQYFGLARADLYVRAADASYTLNFVKAFAEIWLQVLLVTALAVLCSTFLSGPVAILLTVTVIVLGFSSNKVFYLTNCVIYRTEMTILDEIRGQAMARGDYLEPAEVARQAAMKQADILNQLSHFSIEQMRANHVADGRIKYYQRYTRLNLDKLRVAQSLGLDNSSVLDRVYGGGPLEALNRMFTYKNQVVDLDPTSEESWSTTIIQFLDNGMMHVLQYLTYVLPDFRRFADTDYLASGYNIQADLMFQHVTVTLGFIVAAFVAGYFVMKYREMAK